MHVMDRRSEIELVMPMKKAQLQRNADQRLFGAKFSTIVISLLVVAMAATLALLVWQKSTRPLDKGDYEGTIVDRWADYAESDQGSRPRLALVVESQDGKRFTVKVDSNVYESARVGMRIRSRAGQIVLIDSERSSKQR